MRSVLQLANKKFESKTIDASNIAFAERILSYRYARLSLLTSGLRTLLFAHRAPEDATVGAAYSEFHMSAGERAILRLSMDTSKLEDALILIDEIEAGLHPYVQQVLMLELQRLALRNRLQIVVTTHSPTVLETVPAEGRVFLERTPDNVVRREPYRDLIQKALYGRSQDTLSILCEDEEAESFVRGILDCLGPKLDFLQNDIEVGRDTGKDQFLAHLETLGRFRKLNDVLFVLDGDGRDIGLQMEARATQLGQLARLVYLPGSVPPEAWVWDLFRGQTTRYAPLFGLTPATMSAKLAGFDSLYAAAADKPAAIAKNKMASFASDVARTSPEIMRLAGRTEAESKAGEVFDLVNRISDVISEWRSSAR
ncbi:MAG: AAA family ATPase [Limisphaerales bacterium]